MDESTIQNNSCASSHRVLLALASVIFALAFGVGALIATKPSKAAATPPGSIAKRSTLPRLLNLNGKFVLRPKLYSPAGVDAWYAGRPVNGHNNLEWNFPPLKWSSWTHRQARAKAAYWVYSIGDERCAPLVYCYLGYPVTIKLKRVRGRAFTRMTIRRSGHPLGPSWHNRDFRAVHKRDGWHWDW